MQIVWLVAFAAFLVAEGMTMGLYSVWFALGALGALIAASFAPEGYVLQLVLFLVISAAAIVLLRPLSRKWLKPRRVGTNADRCIGELGIVVETICNRDAAGAVYIQGKTWTARSGDGQITIEKDSHVRILAIEGVKLIVEPAQVAPCGGEAASGNSVKTGRQ